jgi:hypothetical protein
VLLVHGRGEMTVLPADTAILLHHFAIDIWTECSVLIQGRGDDLLLPAFTAVLLHHSAMDICTDWSVVSTA